MVLTLLPTAVCHIWPSKLNKLDEENKKNLHKLSFFSSDRFFLTSLFACVSYEIIEKNAEIKKILDCIVHSKQPLSCLWATSVPQVGMEDDATAQLTL